MEYVIERETLGGRKSYFQHCHDFFDGSIVLGLITEISNRDVKRFLDIEEAQKTIQSIIELERQASKLFGVEVKRCIYRVVAIHTEIVKFETEVVFSVENSVSDPVQEKVGSALKSETDFQPDLETPEILGLFEEEEEEIYEEPTKEEHIGEQLCDYEIESLDLWPDTSDEEEYLSEKPKQQYQRKTEDIAFKERVKEDLQQPAEEICEQQYETDPYEDTCPKQEERVLNDCVDSIRTIDSIQTNEAVLQPIYPKTKKKTYSKKIIVAGIIFTALYCLFTSFSTSKRCPNAATVQKEAAAYVKNEQSLEEYKDKCHEAIARGKKELYIRQLQQQPTKEEHKTAK